MGIQKGYGTNPHVNGGNFQPHQNEPGMAGLLWLYHLRASASESADPFKASSVWDSGNKVLCLQAFNQQPASQPANSAPVRPLSGIEQK